MNKYMKAIVAAIGYGQLVGVPAIFNGFTAESSVQTIIGAITVFLVWAVRNEPLIKQDVAAVKDLVDQERAVLNHTAPPIEPTAVLPVIKSVSEAWAKVNAADAAPQS